MNLFSRFPLRLGVGFFFLSGTLRRLVEPHATAEWIEKRPELKSTTRRPPLLMVALYKPPIQALDPTATAVTHPAAQAARQP